MPSTQRHLALNEKTWDAVAGNFYGAEALPFWGPLRAGGNEKILGPIRGRTFLEIGCGSGHSIRYLIRRGAARVYGIDISSVQIAYAEQLNKKAIDAGKVRLFHSAMEKRLPLGPVDTVYSIYGFGWTVDPKTTLAHIHRYLKPGGLFVWSFEHAAYANVAFRNGCFEVIHAYHDERPRIKWKRTRGRRGARLAFRKVSTWFRHLTEAGFRIDRFLEPEPGKKGRAFADPGLYYSTTKAKRVPATMVFVCRKT